MNAVVLAVVLAALFLVLAAPLSAALGRARWPWAMPRPVLVLWQAICLAAGVSLIGAGLALALEPLGSNVFDAIGHLFRNAWDGHPFSGLTAHGVAELTLATAVAAVLLGALLRSAVLAIRRRRAHRRLLDLLTADRRDRSARISADLHELLADVRILDHEQAVAYTVPGWHSRVVLSAGLVGLLSKDELAAVIDHERAHVRSRHDLLVLPFQAWVSVLGWLPGVQAARTSVAELVEMLADDIAAQRSGRPVLAAALARVTLAGGDRPLGLPAPAEMPVATSTVVTRRVKRLAGPRPRRRITAIATYLAAGIIVLIPAALMVFGWR